MKIKNMHYNARNGAFEARVDIERDGKVFRYPCQVPGPLNMNIELVHKGLVDQALRMSDTAGFRN